MQVENYRAELEEMKRMSRQEFVAHLRRYYSLVSVFFVTPLSLISYFLLSICFCRRSSGFSRGASIYRGVTRLIFLNYLPITFMLFLCSRYSDQRDDFSMILVCRHHQHGRWQARIGRVSGNKDLYLGTFGRFLKLSYYMILDKLVSSSIIY